MHALARLKARNPEAADRLVLRKFGLDPGSEDPIQELIQTLQLLRKAGLIEDPRRAGAEDWIQDTLKAVGQGLAMGLAPALLRQTGTGAPGLPPAGASAPSVPQEAPNPAPAGAGNGRMSIISTWVVRQLENLTPAQAADWLLSQPHPQAAELARLIAHTPPDDLGRVLGALKVENPDLAGAVDWILARPDWLLAAAAALRERLSVQGGYYPYG
jgi:hypothetical protein